MQPSLEIYQFQVKLNSKIVDSNQVKLYTHMGLEVTPKMSNRLIRLKKSAVKSTGQSADKYVRPIRDPFPGHLTASHRMLFFVKINRNEMTNELQVTK